MLGVRIKGWAASAITTYTDGYVVGTNGEPPVTFAVLTANITFGGFAPSYPIGMEGRLIFVQDGVGGHDINWNGKLAFPGSSSVNLAAGAVTIIDVINTLSGWVAHKWAAPAPAPAPTPAPSPAPTPAPSPAPTPAPGPTPAPPPASPAYAVGTNLSGMEWAAPGTRYGTSTYPNINYTVPRTPDFSYLAAQGTTLTRLPISWEMLQPLLASSPANAAVRAGFTSSLQATYTAGDFWEPYAQFIDRALNAAQAAGIKIVIDLHNYARYKDFVYQADGSVLGFVNPADDLYPGYTSDNTQVRGTIFALASPTLTQSDFNAFWVKAANRWKTHPGLGGYGLMNEPNQMPAVGKNFGINAYPNPSDPTNDYNEDYTIWGTYAQAAVNAIRAVDATTPIYVGGNGWSAPINWSTLNPMFPLSGSNLVYEFHLYLDATNGGFRFDWDDEVAKGFSAGEAGTTISSATGTHRIQYMLDWAAAHGNPQLAAGEFGLPVENTPSGSLDTRWLLAGSQTVDTLATNNIQTFAWMGGNHWPIHAYPLNNVPKWHQNATVEPIVQSYMKGKRGINQATIFDEGGQYSTSTAIPITVTARGNLTAPVTLTLTADNGGSFSKTTLTLAAGVNSSDNYTFTPPANTISTITYSRTGGGQVPPTRTIYSLTDPVGFASTDNTKAAKAIIAKYKASAWLAKDAFSDYLSPSAAACVAGNSVRAIADSGSGSTIENPMEMLNWLNQDPGSLRGSEGPPLFNNDPNGVKAVDFSVYGRRGLISKKVAPVVAAGPGNDNYKYPAARMPFDLTDAHFMVCAFLVSTAGTTGTLMSAQEIMGTQHSALRINGGKVQLDQMDVNSLANSILDSATLPLNTAKTASFVSSNGAQRLRVDGTQVGATTKTFSTSTFSAATIGYGYWNYYPQDGIQGYEHAWIMGKGSPTDAEMAILETYAKSFAFLVAPPAPAPSPAPSPAPTPAPTPPPPSAPESAIFTGAGQPAGTWLTTDTFTRFNKSHFAPNIVPCTSWSDVAGEWLDQSGNNSIMYDVTDSNRMQLDNGTTLAKANALVWGPDNRLLNMGASTTGLWFCIVPHWSDYYGTVFSDSNGTRSNIGVISSLTQGISLVHYADDPGHEWRLVVGTGTGKVEAVASNGIGGFGTPNNYFVIDGYVDPANHIASIRVNGGTPGTVALPSFAAGSPADLYWSRFVDGTSATFQRYLQIDMTKNFIPSSTIRDNVMNAMRTLAGV